jgi:DNA-binding NtrC family response regulator
MSLETPAKIPSSVAKPPPARFGRMVSASAYLRELFDLTSSLAPSALPILIEGERGTGKQLLAREIHRRSRYSGGPFVVARFGAGGRRAWSDEAERHAVASATGGTLYLDDVAHVPPERLIRLLRGPGAQQTCTPARLRIVAATRVDLACSRGEGRFRELLNRHGDWFPLRLPALDARREDVALLSEYFLARHAWLARRDPIRLSDAAREVLEARSYDGNVSELKELVQRAARRCRDGEIQPDDLVPARPPRSGRIRVRARAPETCATA